MCNLVTCTPRIIPSDKLLLSSQNAISINSLNALPRIAMYSGIETNGSFWLGEGLPSHIVATTKYWKFNEQVKITVSFLDKVNKALRDKIILYLNKWNKYGANILFVHSEEKNDSIVRINLEPNSDQKWAGYWAFLGTDNTIFEGPFGQTMNLESFTINTSDSEFNRVVCHEGGHVLGFPHGHLRKEIINKIDRKKAIAYYKKVSGWKDDTTIAQVLTPLKNEDIFMETEEVDTNSIMLYQIPASITVDHVAIAGGSIISNIDYEFASIIYPT